MGLALSLLFFYLAYHYVPEVRDLVLSFPAVVESIGQQFQ